MKNIVKAFVLTGLILAFASCQKKENQDSSPSIPLYEDEVTVNFYPDFTSTLSTDIFYTVTLNNGDLLPVPPGTPAQKFPELPVFKGWSDKEVIDDLNDLWDFKKDKLQSPTQIFNMYGIWMAEGE